MKLAAAIVELVDAFDAAKAAGVEDLPFDPTDIEEGRKAAQAVLAESG